MILICCRNGNRIGNNNIAKGSLDCVHFYTISISVNHEYRCEQYVVAAVSVPASINMSSYSVYLSIFCSAE